MSYLLLCTLSYIVTVMKRKLYCSMLMRISLQSIPASGREWFFSIFLLLTFYLLFFSVVDHQRRLCMLLGTDRMILMITVLFKRSMYLFSLLVVLFTLILFKC